MIAGVGEALLPALTPSKPASTNPANEVAKNLTGRDYVSWSAISTFRTCPLKYKFRYIDGLPEESVSSALIDELKSDEPTTTGTNGNGAYATAGGAR